MKAELREKSKLLAVVWIIYTLLELFLPTPGRSRGAGRFVLLLFRIVKRIFLSLLMIANVFMTLSFIESKENK